MPFKTIGLSDPLVQGILATGYTAPTEIQSQAIPLAIEGKDIIGCAQTGTGKTAAFVLPILNRLSHESQPKTRKVKSLILTPTRELAMQVEAAIREYGRFLKLRTLAVYGGVNILSQLNKLRRGVDIVVATPGRLMDHMQRRTIDLKAVEVLVLDEADRMFDMGFINDVKNIVSELPENRQTLLFSATMSSQIKTLASGIQKSAKMIQIGRQRNPVDTVTQHIHFVAQDQKMPLLLDMLEKKHMYSVLIFSRTKRGADKICRKLKKADVKAVAIHSDRTQKQRQRALENFRRAKFQVMVATDIAARGIDVEGISHVINYDVPCYAEDYIHRIGRTGRAAATGDAITFVSHEEQMHLRKIEKFIGRNFTPEEYEGFTYTVKTPSRHKSGKKTKRTRPKNSKAASPARKRSTSSKAPGKKAVKTSDKTGKKKRKNKNVSDSQKKQTFGKKRRKRPKK